MTSQTFTHDQLVISPLNVRTNEEDANATRAMEASIAASGLLLPLIVHPMKGKAKGGAKGKWGVCAGGRRWRAIGKLIADGRLPADYPIDCVVRDLDDAEIIELSLDENLLRRELRPYEIHAAIARAHEQGATAEDIAARSGQRVAWVRQQLRLGRLAPPIFQAYAEGAISIDHARAYAATEDHDLQLAVWERLSALRSWDHTPEAIRAGLKVGDLEAEKLLRLVGADIYRAAGGGFELDLFADGPEERGRVMDEALLRQLADNKLEEVRNRIRLAARDRDLRFSVQPPQFAGYTDSALEIHLEGERVDGELRYDLPEGDVIATLQVDRDGKVAPRFWWASRRAKSEAQKAAVQSGAPHPAVSPDPLAPTGGVAIEHGAGGYGQKARAAVKDEHGLTADGIEVVRSLRRMLLRALLLRDGAAGGTLGRDFLVWSQLRQELGRDRHPQAGARGLSSEWATRDDEPRELVRPYLEQSHGHAAWTAIVENLRSEPFLELEDPAEAFLAYVALDEETKNIAAAILAGLALIRSADAPGWQIPVHDALARLAGGDDAALREFWEPTPAFAGLFPKLKRLELAQPFVEPEAFRSWHKLADKPLTGAVAGALAGDPHAAEGVTRAARSWVHPLLSFGVPAEAEAQTELEPADATV